MIKRKSPGRGIAGARRQHTDPLLSPSEILQFPAVDAVAAAGHIDHPLALPLLEPERGMFLAAHTSTQRLHVQCGSEIDQHDMPGVISRMTL